MSNTQNAAKYAHIPPVNRNYLVNGMLSVWQRGITRPVTTTGDWICDRWKIGMVTAARGTLARVSQSIENAAWELRYTITTADASVAVSDNLTINTALEGVDVEAFKFGTSAAKTLTLSFWHGHTVTGTYCVAFRNAAKNRNYVVEYQQVASNVMEKTTITIPGDTSGTWLNYTGVKGLEILFTAMSGSNYETATTDAWGSTNDFSTSNQVNAVATIGNLIRFANLKLEIGEYATENIQPDWEAELNKCQRYYQTNINYGIYPVDNPGHNGALPMSAGINATTVYGAVTFPVSMAINPTMSYYRDGAGTKNGAWAILVGSWQSSTSVTGNNIVQQKGFTCSTPGHTVVIGSSYHARGFWVAEAII